MFHPPTQRISPLHREIQHFVSITKLFSRSVGILGGNEPSTVIRSICVWCLHWLTFPCYFDERNKCIWKRMFDSIEAFPRVVTMWWLSILSLEYFLRFDLVSFIQSCFGDFILFNISPFEKCHRIILYQLIEIYLFTMNEYATLYILTNDNWNTTFELESRFINQIIKSPFYYSCLFILICP